MADHFYSSKLAQSYRVGTLSDITVATSTTSADPLELRITDATVSREQVRQFCERLADYFTVNPIVGTVVGQ